MSLDIWLELPDGTVDDPYQSRVADKNITHNLVGMWQLIGVYDALYMSDKQPAGDHIGALEVGIDFMLERPAECQKHSAPNGWGTYEQALPWLQELLEEWRKYPSGRIRVSK